MSSRKQRQFLQLSIATLFLIQVFYFFSPVTASNFLNKLSFRSNSDVRMRYEIKVTSINGNPLNKPVLISDHWNTFGIDQLGSAQLLIDELARAINQDNFEKAEKVYAQLAEEHIEKLDSFDFEIQQVKLTKVPLKTGGVESQTLILNSWSSDQIRPNFSTHSPKAFQAMAH